MAESNSREGAVVFVTNYVVGAGLEQTWNSTRRDCTRLARDASHSRVELVENESLVMESGPGAGAVRSQEFRALSFWSLLVVAGSTPAAAEPCPFWV